VIDRVIWRSNQVDNNDNQSLNGGSSMQPHGRRVRSSILIGLLSVASVMVPAIAHSQQASEASQSVEAFGGYGGGAAIPEPVLPPGVDVFNLTLEETKLYSRSLNFEVVGHSYFKGPWLTPFAKEHGLGAGFNGVRVYDGIAYLGGYNGPPTVFGRRA
jgi:hypothetical protein